MKQILDIPFSQALSYCFTVGGYKVALILGALVFAMCLFYSCKKASKYGWDLKFGTIAILGFFVLITVFLVMPTNIAANTTPEQAARGVFIGR